MLRKTFVIAAVLFCESLLLWNSSSFHQIVPSPFLFYFLTVETLWFPLWRHSQMFFSLPMSAPLWIFNLEPKFLLWDPTSVATVGNAWPCTNQPTLRLIAKIAVFTFVLQFPFPSSCVFSCNLHKFLTGKNSVRQPGLGSSLIFLHMVTFSPKECRITMVKNVYSIFTHILLLSFWSYTVTGWQDVVPLVLQTGAGCLGTWGTSFNTD